MLSAVLLAISLPVIAVVLRVTWFVGSLVWRARAHQSTVQAFPRLHGGPWRFFSEFRSDKVEKLLDDIYALGIEHPGDFVLGKALNCAQTLHSRSGLKHRARNHTPPPPPTAAAAQWPTLAPRSVATRMFRYQIQSYSL